MKKILSILMAMAMLFAFAAIPAMAADVTVDFTAETNIAYGKTVKNTYVSYGHYNVWYSGTTPAVCSDGSITTAASANGGSSGNKTRFTLDLGAVYQISEISLYQGTEARGVNIYTSIESPFAQNKDDEAFAALVTQVGDGTIAAVATTVNGTACAVNTASSLDVTAQYITFEYPSKYAFKPSEIYVKGTEVTGEVTPDYVALVAADKAALDLGDISAVTENLTLPTVGSVKNSTITWATTDASVITDAGVITRGSEDKTATLTATITNGTVTDTKTFDVTVKGYEVYNLDLSAENNILLGKTVTPIVGHYYSSSTPSAEKQWATDGNLATVHSGYGKVSGATTGVVFSIDLEDEYLIDTLTVLLDEKEAGRGFKLYNGSAVDESKLIGTYPGPAEANYVVAGEQEAALCVVSCELPEATVASQLTIAYPNGYGFSYYEIAATGHAVQDGEIIRDFTSSDNLAYRKTNQRVIGHFAGSYTGAWNPATDNLATDGAIATYKQSIGRYSGKVTAWDDEGNPKDGDYYGSAFRIDLGAYYDLTELTLYTRDQAPSSIKFRSEDAFTTTGGGSQSSVGGFILNSLGGQLHENGFATVGKNDYELVTVNGTEVYQYSADLSNNAQPVRYLMVHLTGGTWYYNELYVAGTPATGLTFAEGDFVYAEDAEAGTKTVTAQVSLMNLTEAATTGNLFYGAYNQYGELVGMTKVADVAVEAGATYSAPTTFNVSAPAGYVKAFYWADGTFVPVIADIICD